MEVRHYAHTLEGAATTDEWQALEEHLRNVAELAAEHAEPFASAEWGELAGRWHDLGKYAKDFQEKLLASIGDLDIIDASVLDERAAGRKVDHSTAGAALVYERCAGKIKKLTGDELPAAAAALAMVIAGHHGGLPVRE